MVIGGDLLDPEFEIFLEKLLRGNEVDMLISGVPFFIGSYSSGTTKCIANTVQDLSTGKIYEYLTRRQLIDNFKYRDKSLAELWPDIEVKDII